MHKRDQIPVKKIIKILIDEKSQDYIERGKVVWLKYNFFAGSLIVSALYISFGISFGHGFNDYYQMGLIILSMGCLAWLCGNHRTRAYSVKSMESKKPLIEKKFLFTYETLEYIKKEKQRRIKMTLNCFRCCGWIFSFLIIGTIGDNIKEFFKLNSLHNYILTLPIIVLMFIVILMSQTIIYYASYVVKKLYNFSKSKLKKYIENGLFVSNYIALSVVEEIVQTHLPKNK